MVKSGTSPRLIQIVWQSVQQFIILMKTVFYIEEEVTLGAQNIMISDIVLQYKQANKCFYFCFSLL